MVDNKLIDVLKRVSRLFTDIGWFVTGDAVKALNGESVVLKNIDLVINYRDIEEALEAVSVFERSEVIESPENHATEFTVNVDGFHVLVHAEYPDGPHSKAMSEPVFFNSEGLTIQCV